MDTNRNPGVSTQRAETMAELGIKPHGCLHSLLQPLAQHAGDDAKRQHAGQPDACEPREPFPERGIGFFHQWYPSLPTLPLKIQ